jgi:hypothetical protein
LSRWQCSTGQSATAGSYRSCRMVVPYGPYVLPTINNRSHVSRPCATNRVVVFSTFHEPTTSLWHIPLASNLNIFPCQGCPVLLLLIVFEYTTQSQRPATNEATPCDPQAVPPIGSLTSALHIILGYTPTCGIKPEDLAGPGLCSRWHVLPICMICPHTVALTSQHPHIHLLLL